MNPTDEIEPEASAPAAPPVSTIDLSNRPDAAWLDEVEGESLLFALRELAVSSGSACTSASRESSYVLRALGRSDQLAQSSIRFSIGRYTTERDVDQAVRIVSEQVHRLRGLAPGHGVPGALEAG